MASSSPTAEGFRLLFRRPSIPFAEIAWRWSFAAAAWLLGAMFLFEYADTLPVTTLDRLLLGTQQPLLILKAIHRIFEGSAFRFTRAGVLLAVALVLAWIVLASIGRLVTVQSLTAEFELGGPERFRGGFGSLVGQNFFRAAITVAAIAAAIGSALFASSLWASTHISVAASVRIWFALLLITASVWSGLNWLLSTSGIFAVEAGQPTFDAIASTVALCVERPGALFVTGTWFGLIHFGAFLFACGAGFTVLGAAGVIGARGVLFLEFLILLAYTAVADFLQIGRLAAYMSILRGGAEPVSVEPAAVPPQHEFGAVDASELILSDVPLPTS